MSQVSVQSLLQDKNGFIWVGTEHGLNKFDGYDFTAYLNDPNDSTSLSYNTVTELMEDDQGFIWAATRGGGVSRFDPRSETFRQFRNIPGNEHSLRDNTVSTLFQDAGKRIWVASSTGLHLYRPASDDFERIQLEGLGSEGLVSVESIASDGGSRLWLATNAGLVAFDPSAKQVLRVFRHDPNDAGSILGNTLSGCCIDPSGKLWLTVTDKGVSLFDPTTGKAEHFIAEAKADQDFRFVFLDSHQRVWVNSWPNGLRLLDKATRKFHDVRFYNSSGNRMANEEIRSILEDKNGSLWVGSFYTGLFRSDTNTKPFQLLRNTSNDPGKLETESFSPVFEDSKGYLWTSTLKRGISRVNPSTNKFEYYDEVTANAGWCLGVSGVSEDRQGYVWVSSTPNGLYRLNPKTKELKGFLGRGLPGYEPKRDEIFCMKMDGSGTLWLGSKNGTLMAFDPVTATKKVYHHDPEKAKLPSGHQLQAIMVDAEQKLWLGYQDVGIARFDPVTETFTKYSYISDDVFSPSAKSVMSLCQIQKDVLWIGTFSGLYEFNIPQKKARRYGTADGLPNDCIYEILSEGENGVLWLSTNKGLSRFDTKAGVFNNFDAEDGVGQNEFNQNAAFKNQKNGWMYFGGAAGLTSFNPKEINLNPNIPPIHFTRFKIYRVDGSETEVKGISYKKQIVLSWEDMDFSVEFAALNYTNPGKNQYAYWLEGYNDDWKYTGTRRQITFTNLNPGTYTLRVKGSNNDGIWNEEGNSLKIVVRPPWWASWWAYSFYALLLLGGLYAAYRYRMNQLEARRLKELDEVKSNMYTHITHEFRTPLTIISGINQQLRERLGSEYKPQLDMVDRNSQNLLHLVNQLLELRKMETGKAVPEYTQDEIIHYLRYISESFHSYAKTREITLHFISREKQLVMDFDPDRLLVILSNLLSNAIKYTPAGGNVYLQIEQVENQLQIRVTDTGMGIPAQSLPHIFERFYKIAGDNGNQADGVGVGLALVKEMVGLLNGQITVESQVGEGSVFTVTLPIQRQASLKTLTDFQAIQSKLFQYSKAAVGEAQGQTTDALNDDLPTILVIEDNHDVVWYLKDCLQAKWAVVVAADGKEGAEKPSSRCPTSCSVT